MRWLFFLLFLATPFSAAAQAVVIPACGSPPDAPLPVGILHNLTMNTTGQVCATTGSTLLLREAPTAEPPKQEEPKK